LQNPQNQAIYSVIHGGINKDLRKQSCEFLTQLPFDGHAIGGSMGKNRTEMIEMLQFLMPLLPEDKPNHLLGIGDLESIQPIVELGVDTFDSSHPTRCARHGLLFTTKGFVKINHASNTNNFRPIDDACTCYTCQNYTRAYLQHLFKAAELSAYTLATIHNLHFMVQLMAEYRKKILNDDL
jgi:queuine tRNA-ribosyltransferase